MAGDEPRVTRAVRPDASRARIVSVRRGLAALALLLVVAVGAGGWHFSDLLIRPGPSRPLEPGVRVTAVDDSSVTLSGSRIARDGHAWFLEWPGGSGILGERLATEDSLVRRRLRLTEGTLAAGDRVDLRAYPYGGDPLRTLHVPYAPLVLDTGLGRLPAWHVPGTRPTCVVFVHGMTATRGEALRILPLVTALGYPSLVIGYRNDPGAPASPDRLSHLGTTEWQDLEGFVQSASDLGARRVVLYGFSMGGAVIAEFLRRSPLARLVAGVVMDAPVLDWNAVVSQGARNEGGVAPLLEPVAKAMVTARTGFSWRGTGPGAWRSQFGGRTPVLLFHGTADRRVPIATSEAFAEVFGARVTLVRTEGADHVQSWNFDPAGYQAALRRWLAESVPDGSP